MLINLLAIFSVITISWLGYNKPKLALYTIVALLPSYLLRLTILSIPVTILELLIIAAFFSILFKITKTQNFKKIKNIFNNLKNKYNFLPVLILLIIIVSIISIAISPEKLKALGLAKAYIWEALMFFILTLIYWQKEDLYKIIAFLIPSAVLINFLAIYQFFTKQGLMEFNGVFHNWRSIGPYNYPNAIGLFLAPLTILFIYLLLKFYKEKKYLLSAGIALIITTNILSIYLAQSEAALLTIIIILFLLSLHHKYLRYVSILCLIISSFIIPQSNLFKPISNKLLFKDFSGQIRRQIYVESSEMLSQPKNLLLGAGLAGYQKQMKSFHLDILNIKKDNHIFEQPVEIYLYPHNIFLNFWTELGLLGMIIFIFLLFYFLISNYYYFYKNNNLLSLILSLTLLSLFIHGLVDVPYFKNDLALLFWLIISISIINQRTVVTKA